MSDPGHTYHDNRQLQFGGGFGVPYPPLCLGFSFVELMIFFYLELLVLFVFFNFYLVDMSELDEKQLMLYAQMANLVNLILQFPSLDLKEIAENFSKVRLQSLLSLLRVLYR